MLWWDLKQLRSNNLEARQRAAQNLSRTRSPEVVDALLGALDKSRHALPQAAFALGLIGERKAITKLAIAYGLCGREYSSEVGDAIEHALFQIDPGWPRTQEAKAAVPALVGKYLESLDYDCNGREYAWASRIAVVLGNIGDHQAIPALLSNVTKNGTPLSFSEGAIFALGMLRATSAVPALLRQLDHGGYHRKAIYQALSLIGDKRALVPLANEAVSALPEDRKLAEQALSRIDPDWEYTIQPEITQNAYLALEKVIAGTLVDAYFEPQIRRMQNLSSQIFSAFANIAVPRLVDSLLHICQERMVPSEIEARAKILSLIDPLWMHTESAKRIAPTLIEVLKTPSKIAETSKRRQRACAASALGFLADTKGLSALINALADPLIVRSVVDGIRRILNSAPLIATESDLAKIALSTNPVREHYYIDSAADDGRPVYESVESTIDLSDLVHLAQQEMQKRRTQSC